MPDEAGSKGRNNARGPGIAKAARPALIRARTLHLVAGLDARWQALLESADVVSEGAPKESSRGRRYYGSTDIVLVLGSDHAEENLEFLTRVAATDPHLRTRAVRLARREAEQRANGPLERLEVQFTVENRRSGIALHLEVEGEVLPDRRAVPRVPTVNP